jgi:hypothetical protein
MQNVELTLFRLQTTDDVRNICALLYCYPCECICLFLCKPTVNATEFQFVTDVFWRGTCEKIKISENNQQISLVLFTIILITGHYHIWLMVFDP